MKIKELCYDHAKDATVESHDGRHPHFGMGCQWKSDVQPSGGGDEGGGLLTSVPLTLVVFLSSSIVWVSSSSPIQDKLEAAARELETEALPVKDNDIDSLEFIKNLDEDPK